MSEKAPQSTPEFATDKFAYNADQDGSYKDFLENGGQLGKSKRATKTEASTPTSDVDIDQEYHYEQGQFDFGDTDTNTTPEDVSNNGREQTDEVVDFEGYSDDNLPQIGGTVFVPRTGGGYTAAHVRGVSRDADTGEHIVDVFWSDEAGGRLSKKVAPGVLKNIGEDVDLAPVDKGDYTDDTSEQDPMKKIGDVINKRIDELKKAGMGDEDAHAQAHDEFWGADFAETGKEDDDPNPTPDPDPTPYPGPLAPPTPEDPTPTAGGDYSELPPPPDLEARMRALEYISDKYAYMLGNRRGKVVSREFSKAELEKVANEWMHARAIAGAEVARQFMEAGASAEDLDQLIAEGATAAVVDLSERTLREELIASGRYERDAAGEAVPKQENKITRQLNKFYDWWGRQKGVSGFVKKAVVGGAVGIVPGLFAATAVGVAGGGILAAGLSARLSKSLLSAKINKSAGSARLADAHQERDLARADELTYRQSQPLTSEQITRIMNGTTEQDVNKNRKRVATAIGAAAVGALVGNTIQNGIQDGSLSRGWQRLTGGGRPGEGSGNGNILGGSGTVDSGPEGPSIVISDPPLSPPVVEIGDPLPPISGSYEYPWDWGVHEFGNANAADKLYELADKAKAAGHEVSWSNIGTDQASVAIDGSSETSHVINILNQYR